KDAVLIDLAIARAKILSTRRPTLLIIEMDETSLDSTFMSEYLKVLASPDIPFQSILVTNRLHGVFQWGGWQGIRLHQSRAEGGRRALTEVIVGDVHSAPRAAGGGIAVE